MTFIYKPKNVAICLGTIIIILFLAHTLGLISTFWLGNDHVFGLVPLFDLDQEHNIPTIYSSVSILLCTGLLSVIGIARKRKGERDYIYWIVLAVVFLFFSIDEIACIHEKLSVPIRNALNTSGFLYFAWVIPYGTASFILLLLYMRFLIGLPPRTRRPVVISGAIYITGSLIFDMIGGYYFDPNREKNVITYEFLTMTEELLEMIGILIFIYALMSYIDSELSNLSFQITSKGNAKPSHNSDKA